MTTGIVISNHGAEPKTEQAMREQFGVKTILYFKHPNIDPHWSKVEVELLAEKYLEENEIMMPNGKRLRGLKVAVVNGEYGFSTACVKLLRQRNVKCYYPTTERNAKEVVKDDGSIEMTHTYVFVRFREW